MFMDGAMMSVLRDKRLKCGLVTVLWCGAWACQTSSPDTSKPEAPKSEQVTDVDAARAPKADEPAAKVAEPPKPAGLAAPTGDYFPAFDMLHNRPLAHRMTQREGGLVLAVDATADDFLRYINGNYPLDWSMGVELDGQRSSALRGGRTAKLWLPAWRKDGAQALLMRVFNPAKGINVLKLKVNGKALEERRLATGWQTVHVPIVDGALSEENTIDVEFSDMGRIDGKLSGGAIAWLKIGQAQALPAPKKAEDGGEAAPKAEDPGLVNVPGEQGPLTLPVGQGAAWMMWALPKSQLLFEIEAAAGCGPTVEVFAQDGAGATRKALSKELLLTPEGGPKQRAGVDLSEVAAAQGQLVRVEVMSAKACKAPLTLSQAQLVVPGKRPERPKVDPPRYILFWMIDTLRADHLPFYNDKTNVEAPALSKLASEGAVFNVAFVQGNESKVSHASLFSGLYPNRHKVLGKGKLKPEHLLMTEAIKAAGYKTGAHISNGYISQPWGFDQGFDHFINNLRDGWRIDGESMAQHGIDWMKKSKDNPFYLYIGTIDPHVTYRAHDGIIEKYDTEPYNGRYVKYLSGEDLGKIKGGGLKVNDRDKTRIINLYKNEITFNDGAFAKLRAAFEEAGIWDKTMVVVTADHGDEFWEHGGVGHGHNIHQELVHVPLLMYYPPLIKANTKVEAGVDVLDVYPTLVDIVGKKPAANLQGKSLVPLLLGQHGGYPEPATATRYLGHYTTQAQQWKLYLRQGDYTLYDRAADPQELTGVEAKYPLAARWLLDGLSMFRANREKWDKTNFGVTTNLSGTFLEAVKKPAPSP